MWQQEKGRNISTHVITLLERTWRMGSWELCLWGWKRMMRISLLKDSMESHLKGTVIWLACGVGWHCPITRCKIGRVLEGMVFCPCNWKWYIWCLCMYWSVKEIWNIYLGQWRKTKIFIMEITKKNSNGQMNLPCDKQKSYVLV